MNDWQNAVRVTMWSGRRERIGDWIISPGNQTMLEVDGDIVEVLDGDVFLLCSDGLSNEVSELAIEQALLPGNCRQASQALIALALERGGHDNITAVVVRAEDLYSPDRTTMHPVL